MQSEKPGRYMVATSRALSKTQHESIVAALTPPLTAAEDLLHKNDLNDLLDKHPEVERRHFKLWLASSEVLSSIVHSGIWSRSEALLEDIQTRVKLYVPHDGYARARNILDKQHVVVIAGSPGVGKSMLAEMLLLTHWKEGWQVVQVGADIEEAWNAWKPEGKQIFLYDDFLGQTNAGESLSKNEDARIAKFAQLVSTKPDKRFVLTTRTQVLREAQNTREPLRHANFDLKTCTVSVGDYHRLHRARIVYNHLYFSGLERDVIREYVAGEEFWATLKHRNFSPRIVEQVLRRPHTSGDQLASELLLALERPVELWGPSFEHGLSDFARELLLTLVTFPPQGVMKDVLLEACALKAQSLPMNQAFRALEDTWIRLTSSGSDLTVAFADPSCRDFVLNYLNEQSDEALRILLGTRTADQAVLLLRYALSINRSEPGTPPVYPGIKSAFSKGKASIVDHFDGLHRTAIVEEASCYALEKLLDTVLSASNILGEMGEAWVEKMALSLPIYGKKSSHEASALGNLILHLGERHAACPENEEERLAQLEDGVRELGLLLAREAQDEDDFQVYRRLTENTDVADLLSPDGDAVLADNVVDYVGQVLSDLTSDYDDPEDMRWRLSELRTIADDFGSGATLDLDFATATTMIDEHESFRAGEDLSPTVAGETFTGASDEASSGDPSANVFREDNEIRTMFAHLL